MRSPKNRSLLSVNEHFEGEHNAEIDFLFSLFVLKVMNLSCRYQTTNNVLCKIHILLNFIFLLGLKTF